MKTFRVKLSPDAIAAVEEIKTSTGASFSEALSILLQQSVTYQGDNKNENGPTKVYRAV